MKFDWKKENMFLEHNVKLVNFWHSIQFWALLKKQRARNRKQGKAAELPGFNLPSSYLILLLKEFSAAKFRWWCVCGKHPFPSRTRKWRHRRSMVLGWRRPGRVEGCREKIFQKQETRSKKPERSEKPRLFNHSVSGFWASGIWLMSGFWVLSGLPPASGKGLVAQLVRAFGW